MNQLMCGKTFQLNLDEFGTMKKNSNYDEINKNKTPKTVTNCVILPLLWFNYMRKCKNMSILIHSRKYQYDGMKMLLNFQWPCL